MLDNGNSRVNSKCIWKALIFILGFVAVLYVWRHSYKRTQKQLQLGTEFENKEKVVHFAMTKVSKTGSSTLFSIFARFVINNELNILSPISPSSAINWWKNENMSADCFIGPGQVDRADVLIHHAKYSKDIYDKYLVKDYKWIVPVREPVTWFKSAVRYNYRFPNYKSPEEVLSDNATFYQKTRGRVGEAAKFHLRQLEWLGFDYKLHDNITAIREYIANIVERMDIIILNDHFDASLLLLRKRFCWKYTDIFYKSFTVTNSSQELMSQSAITKLLSINLGEQLLYEAINKSWWDQSGVEKSTFWNEVSYFKRLNRQVNADVCPQVLSSNSDYQIEATEYHNDLLVSVELCTALNMKMSEVKKVLMNYALG